MICHNFIILFTTYQILVFSLSLSLSRCTCIAVYAIRLGVKESCYPSLSYIFPRVNHISQPDGTELRFVNADQRFRTHSCRTDIE